MIRSLALLALAPAQAGAFELSFPVRCTLGDTCFIQQYPDHDPGPAATDYTCGPLSYDGHDGTDIALPTGAAMQAGVEVTAAAPGVVHATRDGERDGDPVPGRECGNGVLIAHDEGWQTQYCHLRQGSVAVRPGDRVTTGTRLGLVGQSGQAAFPHLHLSVRQNGRERDPFAPAATACGVRGGTLWADPPPYAPGGLVDIGFATEVPAFDAIKAGLAPPVLTPAAPALVLWAHVFGARAGDALLIEITGPDGPVLTERIALDRTQARLFRAVGKRRPAADQASTRQPAGDHAARKWPAGSYTGRVRLMRGPVEIDARVLTAPLGP